MIVLSFDTDGKGRPVVDLFAAPRVSRIAAMKAAGESSPEPVQVRALADTGASRSFVQTSILERLELVSLGTELVHSLPTGSSPKLARLFAIQLFFSGVPGGVITPDLQVAEAEDLSGFGVDMLLGRDVLNRCLLIYNGHEGRFTIAFGPAMVEG